MLGNSVLGFVAAIGFVVGALCSALAGYVSMWVAARSNIRVASAARRSYGEALVVCFRGGAFSAVLNLTLCVAGVTTFYLILNFAFATTTSLSSMDLPMLLVGYGFGASFVALFMQLVSRNLDIPGTLHCRPWNLELTKFFSLLSKGWGDLHKGSGCRSRSCWKDRAKHPGGRSA